MRDFLSVVRKVAVGVSLMGVMGFATVTIAAAQVTSSNGGAIEGPSSIGSVQITRHGDQVLSWSRETRG